MCVNVILCSRNGEKYLRAQIESILKQTEQSVRLLISDDVSSDRTQEIEREYAEQYPERVRVRFRTVPSGGAARRNEHQQRRGTKEAQDLFLTFHGFVLLSSFFANSLHSATPIAPVGPVTTAYLSSLLIPRLPLE